MARLIRGKWRKCSANCAGSSTANSKRFQSTSLTCSLSLSLSLSCLCIVFALSLPCVCLVFALSLPCLCLCPLWPLEFRMRQWAQEVQAGAVELRRKSFCWQRVCSCNSTRCLTSSWSARGCRPGGGWRRRRRRRRKGTQGSLGRRSWPSLDTKPTTIFYQTIAARDQMIWSEKELCIDPSTLSKCFTGLIEGRD